MAVSQSVCNSAQILRAVDIVRVYAY